MQKITTFLWFNNNAEEAVNFYTSIFKNSKINSISRYGQGGPGPAGQVITADFEVEGQQFIALNGGPHYQFTPAISLFVNCEGQDEVDELWNKLTADGGKESRCGWLVDKFGLSWQIVPSAMRRFLSDKQHPEKAGRAMKAMMGMNKIDIAAMEKAYNG